tara:strand:+ start:725 stop:1306 length:582 start_codon:yes stop_codon:yes gene_type:complete
MIFLAIDTSTDICSVSLFNNDDIRTLSKKNTKDHSQYLPIYTQQLISGLEDKIEYIALSVGPGSFTGLKIGSSFSKGLANSLNIPIIPIDNFDAFKMDIKSDSKYYTAIYSHRNYAFACLHSIDSKSDYKCLNISEFNEYPIYGYGFPDNLQVTYNELIPSSERIGIISKKKNKLNDIKSIDNINPLLISVEK